MTRSSLRIACSAAATLSLVGASDALAAGAVYGGSTKAGDAIALTGDRTASKLASAVIALEADCAGGDRLPVTARLSTSARRPPGVERLRTTRNGKGRFAGRLRTVYQLDDGSSALVVAKLAGKLGARRASGTLRADVVLADKSGAPTGACTGATRWSATRAPGRIFAGASSQDEPVVVRLDATRGKVSDLLLGWQTDSCEPPAFYRLGDAFVDFPLQSGSFGDAWDHTFDEDDGSHTAVHYEIAGKLRRTSATGTAHMAFKHMDAAGTTTESCDTGRISWKAMTG
jgi:hypothetical protein